MSTIKSSTTLTTAYSVEADTTGALVIQTGVTPTTALTVGSDQSVTFAGAVSATSFSGSGASLTSLNATNISSGTLASARLPSGTVLQVVSTYLTSSSQLTSSGAYHELSSSLRVSITPKSSTSILYLRAYGSFVSPANNGLMYGAFYDVTNSAYVNLPPAVGSRKQAHWFKRTTSADANDADDMNFSAQVTNTNTTARTYTIYHSTETQTCQFLVSTLSTGGGASYPLYFEVMEIAP
jgi:hypothetical protein